ncbi:MAG: tRNA (adenosine(37)-N6)-dimethylallyltransferase MiaA [Deltaproteobacteria bacterium]|nr:tRNA (adenosine(37)-N6)-dimethylallyltransferase MiaA [Deltaproteobacteria bacterium]
MKPKIIILAGPTASGKTRVALELARRFSAAIVSADSIQIYRFMDIGSAKPSIEERQQIPHFMIDIRYPDEDFSAGDYVNEARSIIRKIVEKSMVPLVSGGTGLYIRLLRGGIADLPRADLNLRSRLLQICEKEGIQALTARLETVDPSAAKNIGPNNLVRILRALEVFELTGRPFSELQRKHAFRDCPYNALYLGLNPEREKLYQAIDDRVDSMMTSGLLDEVRYLHGLGYGAELKPLQSIGYRHAGTVLAGHATLLEATELMKRDTRHYAKRQLTWFRSEPDLRWFDPQESSTIGVEVDNFLEH